jgi:phospholipid-binding lipoprotein MlaA
VGALLCALALVAAPGAAHAEREPAGSDAAAALPASDEVGGDAFDAELESGEVRDPMERVNRSIFAGNQAIDRAVLDPAARFYGWLVPDPAKRAVRRVFENLNLPVVIVNDLLQLEGRLAAEATGRFLLNSTFGLAGVFDPALEAGLESHHADFGQTLGKAGVGPGIYLMVPLFGPSTTRDVVGDLIDVALRPDTWILPLAPRILLGGTWGITEREQQREGLEALEKSSIDFYAAVRSAYWMSREAQIRSDGGAAEVVARATEPGRDVVAGRAASR